jgi:DNA-binding transcriptional LysR family regulator
MPRTDLGDLKAFLLVARERSFTRAAPKLGVSQSALSQTVRGLEERLGLRLLTRTTRSLAPTEAGERLLRTLGPALDDIDSTLAGLSELREKPSGTIRITATENAARAALWPALVKLLPDYPDIHVEIAIGYGLTDIVAERFRQKCSMWKTFAAREQSSVRSPPFFPEARLRPTLHHGGKKERRPFALLFSS